MAVIDELIFIEDGEHKNVDSADNKTIDAINVYGVDYHFAKENEVVDGVCENMVEEPIIDMQIKGNSIQDSDYVQVTHLESTGEQYIDSGFRPNQDTKVYCKFQLTSIGANYPFGSRSSSQSRICYVAGGASTWTLRFGATSSLSYGATDTELHEVEMSLAGVYFDNQLIGTPVQDEFSCAGNLYIFGLNQKDEFLSGKTYIYAFKLWNKGVLVRDFVPCYRKSDNVAGLYDNVNKTFYTNNGTGEFIIGSVVNAPSIEMPIEIESVGDRTYNLLNPNEVEDINQYINANAGTLMTPSSSGGIWRTSGFIRIESGKTYHFNAINNDAWTAGMAWYDDTKTYISGLPTGSINLSGGKMIAPENALYMRVSWRIEDEYNPAWQNTVQVVEGDTAKEFEPYGYKVPIEIGSRNILDLYNASNYPITKNGLTLNFDKETGRMYISGTASLSTGITLQPELFLENSKTYTMSVLGKGTFSGFYSCAGYDENSNNLWDFSIGTGTVRNKNITNTNKVQKVDLWFSTDTSFEDGFYVEIQIEEGNNFTEFRPYVEPATTNIYLSEPLRKIGDYADYIDYKNKKVVRNVDAYVFKEPDNDWLVFADSVTEKTMGVYYRNSTKLGSYGSPTFKNNSKTMCNAFKYQSGAGIHSANDALLGLFMTAANSAPPYFAFKVPYTTLDDWKAKITELNDKGTPLTVCVVKATPTEEPIDIPEISTFKGTNVFDTDTTIKSSEIYIKYWKQI